MKDNPLPIPPPKDSGGTHILLDLKQCFSVPLLNHELYFPFLLEEIHKVDFNPIKEIVCYFGEQFNSGYTGIIVLSESHISFHTFPEELKVQCDIFTCNYSRNNTESTKKIANYIKAIFKPQEIHEKLIFRH